MNLYFCTLHNNIITQISTMYYSQQNQNTNKEIDNNFFRKIVLLSILTLLPFLFFANPVRIVTAKQVAKNFFYERANQYLSIDYNDIIIESEHLISRNGSAALYIFNVKNHGFVIVSGDDAAIPVLGYDFSKNIDFENPAPSFEYWINTYANQIEEIWEENLLSTPKIDSLWNALSANTSSKLSVFNSKSQLPLLISEWDQGGKFNALCPEDQFGPGGRVYAGCVAVAMAQVMYYYKYPSQGNGSYSYFDNSYGLQSANFGSTYYKWNEMANIMPNEGNFEIAQLLYQCGVSVDMNYGASGSGAWSNNVVSSLVSYFGYSNSVHIDSKYGFTDTQWSSKIIQSIDYKIPLYYHGYPSGGGAGHAFNLDGYQGSDYFHFNWGWSGNYNGYFYLNNINPGGNDFASGQGAIFDIKPISTNYPSGCQTQTITSTNGVIFDGSGPADYSSNNNCQWLISPYAFIDHIEFKFDRLNLAIGDTIYIYDGNSTNDSLLIKITDTVIPSSISSSGTQLLVRFTSDNQYNGDGFDASFHSVYPVFCQGTLVITDSAGIISDGSDTNDYNNGVMCKWMIQSTQPGVTIHFTKFNTESGKDWVKIYDPTVSPSVLLGQFSGNQIPPDVSASNGKMLIVFATNEATTREGWEAEFITGNVGIENANNINQINIFPNPAQNHVNIDGINPNQKIQIQLLSIDGREVFNENTFGLESIRLNLNDYSNGLYILHITNGKDLIYKKLEISK